MRLLSFLTRKRRIVARSPNFEAWKAGTEAALQDRAARRPVASRAAKAGAGTKVHSAKERDAVLNQRPAIVDPCEWATVTEANLKARRAARSARA
jgi:hypothetical protein